MKKLEKSMPVIRFKGFSEAWEQRKLGKEVENVATGRSTFFTSIEQSSETPYAVLGSTSVISYDKNFDHSGDFILTARVGANAGNLYKYSGDVKISDNTVYIQAKSLDFVYYLLNKFDLKRLSFGTGQPLVKASELKNLKLMFPNDEEEQQKIGKFFKYLDDTIALHQRKLDALKLMKKGFLQQMFPKRGENIPKIRLDDFDDIWEQRILGEFLKESKIKGSNGSLAKKLTVKLWRKGVVPKEEIYTGSSATQYYIRKTGQFIYGKLDFLNQAFGIIPLELDGYESTLDSPAFDIEESINETFLLEYVSLVRFYKYQGNIANGSRRAKRIHTDTFFEMPIPLPNSNEQQKIGTFSQQIDDLIALQQNKLEKISSLKRFYLKNMFI
ncbi:TPA: restriction endonuclease subunit S [Listeria monocytogenes]|nr:restriction endonuclease subunit S [Listeria monocytogenes]HAO6064244.1 restriction endonuclease subunit S [Listeria monocytogenes]HAO6450535.1 restriction endonuclease subunit S [Listeria monocytogenes]HAO6666737.1 restriction endonuclease subunit S [Listeria monocytogenes]